MSQALLDAGESPRNELEPLAVDLRRDSMNVDLWGSLRKVTTIRSGWHREFSIQFSRLIQILEHRV